MSRPPQDTGASRSRARARRLGAGLTIALLALAGGLLPVPTAGAAPSVSSTVTVSVLSVSPSTPVASLAPRPLTVRLQLTNTGDVALPHLSVEGARGDPISNQSALDDAIKHPGAPDPSLQGAFAADHPVTASLAAGASTTVSYVSSTSTSPDAAGLCLCQNRIYPLYLSVISTQNGFTTEVGATQTYLPSFGTTPAHPVRVAWVWPILEPPHRAGYTTQFTDDTLAASVDGGRLDRVLQVAQNVGAAGVAMTLLIDPDLIDELTVLAGGHYTIRPDTEAPQRGTASTAAADWLSRLAQLLDTDPQLQLEFTPFGDPDTASLARAGLSWTQNLSAPSRERVLGALDQHTGSSDLAWPVSGSLDAKALATMQQHGVRTVLLPSTAVRGGSAAPDTLARVRTTSGVATLALTSAAEQKYVAAEIGAATDQSTTATALPELVSELAVRDEASPAANHLAVITPPREVDPNVAAATAAIEATAHSYWSTSVTLAQAVAAPGRAPLVRLASRSTGGGLPAATITAARYVDQILPVLHSVLTYADAQGTDTAAGQLLVDQLSAAMQRAESAGWAASPATSAQLARAVQRRLWHLVHGPKLIKPSSGSYTLGSSDSPLPITISNTLPLPVHVRVTVSTGGIAGFTASSHEVYTVGPRSKVPVHLPAHNVRVGRIQIRVQLRAPDGHGLGSSLPLSVRSTALGTIGKVITIVAAIVLVLALLWRALGRLRRRRRKTPPALAQRRDAAEPTAGGT